MEYGCGQCLPCRLNRRRLWTGRLLLEATQHAESLWATLTYDDSHVPPDGVNTRDYQLFLKRLRARIAPVKVRFYIVGEYGERYGRPHYHCALFGIGDRYVVRDSWGMGNCWFGDVNASTMGYNCSHITSELGQAGQTRGDGRNPIFHRMSLNPGIGATALVEFARWLHTDTGSRYLLETGDVNAVFRTDGLKWPLGRYLRGELRRRVGFQESKQPAAAGKLASMVRGIELSERGYDCFEPTRVLDGHTARRAVRRLRMNKQGNAI